MPMTREASKIADVKETIDRALSELVLAMASGSGAEVSESVDKLSETLARLIVQNAQPDQPAA